MSNILPKLTNYRDRAIRIETPFQEAARVRKDDLSDLKQEFFSALKAEGFDAETIKLQWDGITLNVNNHFTDADKRDKARLKRECAAQYEMYQEPSES